MAPRSDPSPARRPDTRPVVLAGALLVLILVLAVIYGLYTVIPGDPESVDQATDELDVGTYGETPSPPLPIVDPLPAGEEAPPVP